MYKEFINEVKVVFLHKSKKWGSDNLVTGLTLEAIQNTLDLLSTRRGQLKENIMNVGVTRQQFSKHIQEKHINNLHIFTRHEIAELTD